jgi:subtilisin family serine protease
MAVRRSTFALGLGFAVWVALILRGDASPRVDQGVDGTVTVDRDDSGGVWVSSGAGHASVPGELIVKYRETVLQPVDRLLARGMSFRDATRDGGAALDALHARFGVRGARPVFRTATDEAAAGPGADQAALRRAVADRLAAARRRHPDRSLRAVASAAPDLSHVYVLGLAAGTDVDEAAAAFAADPHVAYAQPNYRAITQFTPNDPYYASAGSWGQPYDDLWGLKAMQLEGAWDLTQGAGIVVGVVDTGLDRAHPDIVANLWSNPSETVNGIDDDGNGYVDDVAGWDFANNDADPADGFGHGTHVSGTIAAAANNGIGIVGVAPQARVMAVKGLSDAGSGTIDDLAAGIVYAAENGADVINNSWGCSSPCPSSPVAEDAVRAAYALGTLVVFAAGNRTSDLALYSPQNMPEALVVAASTNTDALAFFSNYGPGLDVAAPGAGDNVAPPATEPFRATLSLKSATCSTALCPASLVVGGSYLRQAGTSMAAPHVAGLAALVLAAHPGFTVEQVRQAIRRGCDDPGALGFDDRFGYGRVNALGALAESAPLAAVITSPGVAPIGGFTQIGIDGVAAGPGFSSYRVEFGTGSMPAAWTTLATSTVPVSSPGRLFTWDVSSTPDGPGTLRLLVFNASGQVYEDRQPITIDQVRIVSPDPATIGVFRPGTSIAITGTVYPADFSSYRVIIRDRNGAAVNADVVLANGGLQRVSSGLLATWNTAGLPANRYTISLEVALTAGGTLTEQVRTIVDPTLHPGWPIQLGLIVDWSVLSIADHLAAADVDRDGRADLLVGYGDTVRIFNGDGAMLPGWPRTVDPGGQGDRTQRSPAVGDLTGDGVPEVIAATNGGRVFVWSSNGTPIAPWPLTKSGTALDVAAADVNGDGRDEIVVTGWSGVIDVIGVNGVSLPGWPRVLSGTALLPPVIGDVGGDGTREILVAGNYAPSNLWLLSSTGQILPGWPRALNASAPPGGIYYSYPAMGELDDDATREIVAGSGDGRVFVFNHDGTDVPGWPRATVTARVNSPGVGDLDGDGRAEVVAGLDDYVENGVRLNALYAWRRDGTLLPGWPVRINASNSHFFGMGGVALADVDGDGRGDVVVSNDGVDQLAAYTSAGVPVTGFPKAARDLGFFWSNAAAVADFDGDGLLEVAWVDLTGTVYLWDVPAPRSGPRAWPMFQHDGRLTGAGDPEMVPPHRDVRTQPGSIVSGSFADTRVADDVREVFKTSKGKTLSLIHTWQFDNVPIASHRLVIEGFRPANSAGDDFKFSWSSDNVTYQPITGAVVNFPVEQRIEASFGPTAFGRTIYIRAENTVTTGSTERTLQVDSLSIRTVPSAAP